MANPNKTRPVQDILLKNQERLIDFLSKFHNDRSGKTLPPCVCVCVCVFVCVCANSAHTTQGHVVVSENKYGSNMLLELVVAVLLKYGRPLD